MAKTYRVAVIAGDGIGKEVVPEGVAAMEAAARRYGFGFAWQEFDWSCETYAKTGRMMPEDGIDQLRAFDSVFLGAVGYPGSVNGYQVNFRVPTDAQKGTASVQVIAAWISGPPATFPVQ